MEDVREYSVKWIHWDSDRECLKFDKIGKPSSSTIITANNYYQYIIRKMHCQQFIFKFITLHTKSFRPHQFITGWD